MTASAAQAATGVTGNSFTPLSQSMRAVQKLIAEVARTDIPVLLVGESGTGKEVLARHIHSLSGHCSQPFRKIACASMSPSALSAEIAHCAVPSGNQETRDARGTVLFDELSDLEPACQRSLLCALPDGGESSPSETIQGRLISTTTRDLVDEVRAGRFRSELYYRINGVSVRLPPLRERKEDIPGLVELLLMKHATQLRRPRPVLRPESRQAVLEYSWPGNIRELENVIRKIVVLGDERWVVSELRTEPSGSRKEQAVVPSGHPLKVASRAASRQAERELIMWALAHTRWNRKRAAQELQISYKSLLYKMKQIGIVEESQAD